jgi:glycosyltransferase involved in cell wall biosynthesis
MYVTGRALQERYPCPRYMAGVSDIDLFSDAFGARRQERRSKFRLVTIAAMDQPYKGIQHLLPAVARCAGMGLDVELSIVGDGRLRPEFERQTASLGLVDRVTFAGRLPAGSTVRAALDGADLFVLPSLTEGLPRAMIEAMARGLPCIGSTVGGIPELLAAENMTPPGDVAGLAAKIAEIAANPARMAKMSAENLAKAMQFADHALRDRRTAFYRRLREATAVWIAAGGGTDSGAAAMGANRCA